MTAVLTPGLAEHAERLRAGCPHATAAAPEIAELLGSLVAHPDFPCLGARSVFRRNAAQIHVFPSMKGISIDVLGQKLRQFAAAHDGGEELASFVAVFREPVATTEEDFERNLWGVLRQLHDHDDQPWAEDVSQDPDDPEFAFSFAGTPYFIVGLHPAASRIARQAPVTTIVFNLHRQFERLRTEGTFERMRDAIRRRDERLQGDINPMMDDYGTSSAARQYSGRAVGADWRAPFSPKEGRR
ncbi:MAG: YqcI/YcgG family protein [Tetrasphaera sp.]|nr:YqcI/YcgG family protein [Tetrasphaera sp.]